MFSVNYSYRKKITAYWCCHSYGKKMVKAGRKSKRYYKRFIVKKLRKHSYRVTREYMTYDYQLSKLTVDNLWELYDYSK